RLLWHLGCFPRIADSQIRTLPKHARTCFLPGLEQTERPPPPTSLRIKLRRVERLRRADPLESRFYESHYRSHRKRAAEGRRPQFGNKNSIAESPSRTGVFQLFRVSVFQYFPPMYRRCGFRYEKKLRTAGVIRIAGIDEAGRGALAGPVVAAAAVLPEKFRHRKLNDSKQ